MIIGTAKREKEGARPLPTRHFSKKQEEAVAKATGGKRTPNSGATDFGGKSDVDIANLFNIECKTKTSNSESISIKKEWIHKNKREALFDGNPYSAIAFNFGPDSENYYIIDEYLFLELIDHLKTLDEPL
jgi:hypothetical protein